jgi:hypothetical protein
VGVKVRVGVAVALGVSVGVSTTAIIVALPASLTNDVDATIHPVEPSGSKT